MENELEQEELAYYHELKKKFFISLAGTLLLMAVMHLHVAYGDWAQFVLAAAVIFWPGLFLLKYAWESVKLREPDMFTLIGVGILSAFFFSCFVLIADKIAPEFLARVPGGASLYFEPAAMIAALVILGQMLEARAFARTNLAVKSLLKLAPETAGLIGEDGEVRSIPLAEVRPGDRLRVDPGEKIPVDGEVLRGVSHVDESMISGEPMPAGKKPGRKVIGGTLNMESVLEIRAEAVGKDTLLSRMIALVETAQSSRSNSKSQKLVDRIASVFVPGVLLISVITFVVWLTVGKSFEMALGCSIAVLLAACPCVLGLAAPMSITIGIGEAARRGILVKNFEALEHFLSIKYLILDKTGTLTKGVPEVVAVVPAAESDGETVLRLAAALESSSRHPLAAAVMNRIGKTAFVRADKVQYLPGLGLKGELDGETVLAGSLKLMEQENIFVPPDLPAPPGTLIAVASGGRFTGYIAVSDPLREESRAEIEAFRTAGVIPVLLTGDNRESAERVARELGIEEVVSNALPADKFAVIKRYQDNGDTVAMVGDGVNDAAALTLADVGIAMGGGSDAALESAHITLLDGDISKLHAAYELSGKIRDNIRQNLFFAFFYNVLVIPLGAGVFYPLWGLTISPAIGSVAMSISSICVVMNALRLRKS